MTPGKNFIAGVKAATDKLFTGVNDNNCSPVLLTLVKNLSPVSTTPAITENPWQGLLAGNVDTSEQLIASVVDIGDKHSFANISTNFRKILSSAALGMNLYGMTKGLVSLLSLFASWQVSTVLFNRNDPGVAQEQPWNP